MAIATLFQAIQARFHSNWDRATTPVSYQNTYYQPPDHVDEWVRLNILPAESINGAIAGAMVRNAGIIDVQVFARENRGVQVIASLVDDVKTIFENQNFSGVRCYATSVFLSGAVRDGWFQANVSTRYEYDEVA